MFFKFKFLILLNLFHLKPTPFSHIYGDVIAMHNLFHRSESKKVSKKLMNDVIDTKKVENDDKLLTNTTWHM